MGVSTWPRPLLTVLALSLSLSTFATPCVLAQASAEEQPVSGPAEVPDSEAAAEPVTTGGRPTQAAARRQDEDLPDLIDDEPIGERPRGASPDGSDLGNGALRPKGDERVPPVEVGEPSDRRQSGPESGDGPKYQVTPAVEPSSVQVEPEFHRPGFKTLRFEEDWSDLQYHQGEDSDDFFDPLKYVPISADGSIWIGFGGQWRGRVEAWHRFGFNGPGDRDDIFLLNRFRYHADFHATEYFRVFLEGKSAFVYERNLPGGRRTSDVDELDLQNGFVEFRLPFEDDAGSFTFRAGRQELRFGVERLVSPLDWSNTRRTFDGFSGILDTERWRVHAFWTQQVPVDKYDFNSADSQGLFYGLYSTMKYDDKSGGVDLYFLGLDNDVSAAAPGFNGSSGDEMRFSLGARAFGNFDNSNLDYDIEATYQIGEIGDDDINAYSIAALLGYTFPDNDASPRVYAGVDYASGDRSVGGSVQTFNQLFPLGHAYLGYIDVVGRQNIAAARLGFQIDPTEQLRFHSSAHAFLRASTEDALYSASGAVLQPDGGPSSSSLVGFEVDLSLRYLFNRHLEGAIGYSHFFAGDFIEDNRASAKNDIDFLWLALTFTF